LAIALLALLTAAAHPSTSSNAQSGAAAGDAQATPERRVGGGFEFRHRPSTVDNPYCDISTYVLPDFAEQASSTFDAEGHPAIAIDASVLKDDVRYAHFLMAHECCHHVLGHVRLTSQQLGQVGPQPFYYIQPLLRGMELDADACAARMLSNTHEPEAIETARLKMLEFGAKPTGAYYPTGIERADAIAHAASEAGP
jgi:hypothetical protein